MRSSEPSVAERARHLVGGQRALVVGLAREGVDLARFLTGHGAHVIVTDQKPADQLSEAMAQLNGAAISYRLGGHSVNDLIGVDVVRADRGLRLVTIRSSRT